MLHPGIFGVLGRKAYTAASRHRVASYIVTSDGAERREIASCRSLGDPRPIREADVWPNMARNLERQPPMLAALDLLERALQGGAARALPCGLQPAEQRAAVGLPQATLHHAWQRPVSWHISQNWPGGCEIWRANRTPLGTRSVI